jgi:hypothetical protein
MRRVAAKLFFVMAITVIAAFGADNSVGTWKLNPAKSKTTSTNPITSRTDVWEATPDGGVKVTRTEKRVDGTAFNFSYTFKYDGKEYPVTGGPFNTVSAKRIDANTTILEVKMTGGKYHQVSRNVFSKDGRTRTSNTEGTDAQGKPVTSTYIYDKQ